MERNNVKTENIKVSYERYKIERNWNTISKFNNLIAKWHAVRIFFAYGVPFSDLLLGLKIVSQFPSIDKIVSVSQFGDLNHDHLLKNPSKTRERRRISQRKCTQDVAGCLWYSSPFSFRYLVRLLRYGSSKCRCPNSWMQRDPHFFLEMRTQFQQQWKSEKTVEPASVIDQRTRREVSGENARERQRETRKIRAGWQRRYLRNRKSRRDETKTVSKGKVSVWFTRGDHAPKYSCLKFG